MCSSKAKKPTLPGDINAAVASINGRPVLQPACNRVATVDRRNSLKKLSPKPPPPPPILSPPSNAAAAIRSRGGPISPNSKSPRPAAIKRGGAGDITGLNSSCEKISIPTPKSATPKLERKKSRNSTNGAESTALPAAAAAITYSSSMIVESPGSIAAVRREQVALQQAQRKMRIAHYGRTNSGKFEAKIVPLGDSDGSNGAGEEKRCSFITPNSDPLYVAYHDEEWGVPVQDDKMLFELLVLSGAQVGSDWTSILKRREDFRVAFSGFDPETVANFTEKQITSVSADYGIDVSRVRGVVDNSNRILEVKKAFGSFGKYIWGFVNHKPISTQYKFGHKIAVKTSKSECISKDMVRRGFRSVGPTVIHSFMQAAGLTNDHLVTCHRHHDCAAMGTALASSGSL